jgi:LacI family transcriptional regulator
VVQEIGIILPNITNPFYSLALLGIEKEFQNTNYSVLLYSSFRDTTHEYELLKSMYQKGIKGVIISSVMQDTEKLQEFIDRGMKLVFLDQKINGLESHISFEYREGAYNAVKYLYELGHRKISLAITPLTRWTRKEFFAGYKQALEDLKLGFSEELLLVAQNENELENEEEMTYETISGQMKAREFIEKRIKSTAILCINDMVAFGLIRELQAHNIKVPEHVSVIGCDDIPFSAIFSPALTTIHCPTVEIGHLAAQMLQRQLKGLSFDFGVKLSARLIKRQSTAGR